MVGMFPLLEKALAEGPVIDKNGYPYFVNPISDGIPRVEPALLEEVVEGILGIWDDDCDIILAPEAMGIPLATAVSLRTGIPFTVIRKRSYGLQGELEIRTHTGYSESRMYLDCVSPGERAIVIDDVVSTGGTLSALSRALSEAGVDLVCALVVFNKSDDIGDVRARTGIDIRTLVDVRIVGGRPVILRPHTLRF